MHWFSYHDCRREIAARVSGMQICAKFENVNNVAASCFAAVVLEELTVDSALLEASNTEDDEFLLFLLIDSNERKSHV